jgi:hypothetical protein
MQERGKAGVIYLTNNTRADRKFVALLASILKFISGVEPKASGLLLTLVLASAASRAILRVIFT